MKKPVAFFMAVSFIMLTACSQAPVNKKDSSAVSASSGVSSAAKNMSSTASSSVKSTSSANKKTAKVKVHESTNKNVIRLYNEAAKYYQKKDYTSVVTDCDKALAIDPLCYEALNLKGAAQYYASGDPQQGLPYINKCIQINPYYQYGYFDKALIYKGEKNWDVSISLFNKVIELAPGNAWAYYGISTIYADRNMVSLSLKYLKKAIEVDPSVKETARVQDHYDRMRSNKAFQALVK